MPSPFRWGVDYWGVGSWGLNGVSLNTLTPEAVAFGTEILLQAKGPTGGFVTIAEVYEMQCDANNNLEQMPVWARRNWAYRRGRYSVAGTIKGYWLNSTARSMILGNATPSSAGSNPLGY